MVTKMIRGLTLRALAAQLDSEARHALLAPLLYDLLDALDALHRLAPPVIHRDVKPENVMVSSIETPSLTHFHLIDLGAVGFLGSSGSTAGVGTFGFLAPEQLYGDYSQRSDLFATGVTALSFLTNSEPARLPKSGLMIDVAASAPALSAHVAAFISTLLQRIGPIRGLFKRRWSMGSGRGRLGS